MANSGIQSAAKFAKKTQRSPCQNPQGSMSQHCSRNAPVRACKFSECSPSCWALKSCNPWDAKGRASATAGVTLHQRTYIRRLAAVNRMLLFDLWPMALHDMSFESSRYHAPSLQPPTLLDPFLSSTCQAHLQSFGVLLLFLLAMLLVVRPQPPDIGSFQFQSKAMM